MLFQRKQFVKPKTGNLWVDEPQAPLSTGRDWWMYFFAAIAIALALTAQMWRIGRTQAPTPVAVVQSATDPTPVPTSTPDCYPDPDGNEICFSGGSNSYNHRGYLPLVNR